MIVVLEEVVEALDERLSGLRTSAGSPEERGPGLLNEDIRQLRQVHTARLGDPGGQAP